jgi:hypothetical protein
MGDNNNAVIDLHQNSNDFYVANFRNGGGNGKGVNIRVGGTSSNSIPFRVARNDDTELFRIIGNGNVGIGTTSPTEKLHVLSPTAFNIKIERSSVGSALIGISGQTPNSTGDLLFDMTQASQGFMFRSRNASNAIVNSLAIDRNGNVGIGTTAPLFSLDVRGNSPFSYNRPSIGGSSPDLLSYGYMLIPQDGGPFFDMIRSSNTSLRFATETSFGTGFSTQMTLTQNGNVGIGTTAPAYKLEVNGLARLGNSIIGNSTSQYPIQFVINSTTHATSKRAVLMLGESGGWQILNDIYANGTNDFGVYGNGRWGLTIQQSTGNVGIGGTVNPVTKLSNSGTLITLTHTWQVFTIPRRVTD